MQKRIRRMALISSCGLALGAFVAAPAQAAVQATTGPATSIKETSAFLNGTVNTGGLGTQWEFQYGKTTSFGKFSSIHTIGFGKGTVAVSAKITHLTPGTTYHYRLLATSGNGTQYYPLVASQGRTREFTTNRGRLTLDSTKLTVKKGSVSVGLRCASTSTCKGSLSITTRIRVNGRSKKLTCAETSFTINAEKGKTLNISVSKSCLALLKQARHQTIGGTLSTKLKSRQHGLNKSVTLILK